MRSLPYSLDMTAAIAPIAIALISLVLRLVNLGSIKSFIFD